jgi:hypothetical protein
VYARAGSLLCVALLWAVNTAQAAESSSVSVDSQLFDPIAKVLLHPRCLNCHTSVDYPKQGDDRHPHWFRVMRGGDDRGAPGMRCAACHQPVNNEASGVPGAPNWHAAPRSMAWEQKTPAQLCRVLLDKSKNGNRSIDALVEHMSNDPLVAWGWAPGAKREPVPIAKPEFVTLLQRWQKAGAPCPT